MSKRPRRKVVIKSDIPIKLPRKWKKEEMETILNCIMEHGHKNLNKIQELLPGRSIDKIKTFMRSVQDVSGKMNSNNTVLDIWINHCNVLGGTPWRDCLQIAQVLKYLSVDGLLENHPLPERCQGIEFGQAYRFLYQAMMGYPIQPVNKPTADFVLEALAELSGEIKKQTDAIKQVESYLQNKSKNKEPNPVVIKSENSENKASEATVTKKPLKVYQRKKLNSTNTVTAPSLRIIVEESSNKNSITSGYLKDFSVTVEGKDSSQSTTVNVPVSSHVEIDEDEEELLKSQSYNPFQIPKKWLEEPLYLNLIQKL